jgi:selenocysteine-specific translation elongation factor
VLTKASLTDQAKLDKYSAAIYYHHRKYKMINIATSSVINIDQIINLNKKINILQC